MIYIKGTYQERELISFTSTEGLLDPQTICSAYCGDYGTTDSINESWLYFSAGQEISEDAYAGIRESFFGQIAGEDSGFTVYSGATDGVVPLSVRAVSASSEVLDAGVFYTAANAVDGDITTSWQEAVYGNGAGESITLSFDQAQTVSMLRLRLGSAKSDKSYADNGKPTRLLFEFSDGTCADLRFDTTNSEVYVLLPSSISTEYVCITILEAQNGDRWDDTAISEIEACFSAV